MAHPRIIKPKLRRPYPIGRGVVVEWGEDLWEERCSLLILWLDTLPLLCLCCRGRLLLLHTQINWNMEVTPTVWTVLSCTEISKNKKYDRSQSRENKPLINIADRRIVKSFAFRYSLVTCYDLNYMNEMICYYKCKVVFFGKSFIFAL